MHRLVNLLIVMALVLRGLVPAGFMLSPLPDGSGAMQVVICTGHGAVTATLDQDGKPVTPKPNGADLGTCVFKISAPVAIAVADPAPAPSLAHAIDATTPIAVPSVPWSLQAAPPPARGPPTIS